MTRRGLQIRRHSEIEREIKHVRTATAAHLACIRSARPKVQYRVLLGSHCPLRSSVRACIGPSEAERCTEQRNTSGRETAALMEQSDGCSVRNGARKIHTSRRGPRRDGTNRALFFHASHTHTHTHAAVEVVAYTHTTTTPLYNGRGGWQERASLLRVRAAVKQHR